MTDIRFLLVRRVPDRPSSLLREVVSRLRRRGHTVSGAIVEDVLLPADPRAVDDDVMFLLKSHTETALSHAAALHARGARVFNPYPACAAAQDKVLANQRLAAAGVRVPDTWVTGSPGTCRHLLDDGPLVVKPVRGHRGAGVHVVRTPRQLDRLPDPGGPVVVQRHVDGPGHDLKVYVVGSRVWAVRKPFDATSFTRPGEPVPVTAEVEDLARRVGRVSGLDLFGIDVIEGPDGPTVVDLNYFPGYKGCEEVAGPMADHVHRIAVGDLAPPPLPPLSPAPDTPARGPALVPAGSR